MDKCRALHGCIVIQRRTSRIRPTTAPALEPTAPTEVSYEPPSKVCTRHTRATSRRFAAPRRGAVFPSRAGASGSVTSHGPFRKSYKPFSKASGNGIAAEEAAPGAPADAAVFAEGVRETLPPAARPPALLQPGMPGGSPSLVALEGPATLPGYGGGPAEAQPAKPALPGARPKPKTACARGRYGSREGHPSRIFFRAPVTARVATWSLIGVGDHPCNGSARGSAGGLGSASGSGSGTGGRHRQDPALRSAHGRPPAIAAVATGRRRAAR